MECAFFNEIIVTYSGGFTCRHGSRPCRQRKTPSADQCPRIPGLGSTIWDEAVRDVHPLHSNYTDEW